MGKLRHMLNCLPKGLQGKLRLRQVSQNTEKSDSLPFKNHMRAIANSTGNGRLPTGIHLKVELALPKELQHAPMLMQVYHTSLEQ